MPILQPSGLGLVVRKVKAGGLQHLGKKRLSVRLDEVLASEVRPQVDDLPRAQTDKHSHGTKCEPLDALVCALIGVSQLLLACSEIVHLGDNFCNDLLNPPQFGLDRLQLLASLNGAPVLGVSANVNVELDVARASTLLCAGVNVLEADIESGIGVRGESVAVLADNILGLVVVVAHCIADLSTHEHLSKIQACCQALRIVLCTYVHVDLLAITPISIQNSCDDHELVFCDKVTDASLVLRSVVRRDGVEVEFEGGGEWRNDGDQQCEEAQYPVHGGLCALRRESVGQQVVLIQGGSAS
jgi:hypothetical protein